MSRAELHFRAMGTDCQAMVLAPAGESTVLVELVRDRVELLEQCWSRFRPDSELNRLNAHAGLGPMPVSEDLLHLVQHMQHAWELTRGLFDPTVLAAMHAHGYDTDFATVASRPADALTEVLTSSTPGMSAVLVDADHSSVTLPSGIGLDPGAIGKGLAADLIVDEILGAGATGALVNLGGDVAIGGHDVAPWAIAVQDERKPATDEERVLTVLHFDADTARLGTATSTTLKRRWAQGRRHHVIDPRTGTMSTSSLVQVTVVASTAWQAEVLATAALLLDPAEAADLLRSHGLSSILMTSDDIITVPDHLLDLPTREQEHAHG
jgi:thiamine biosynthesis lipoprotein